ncbi:hypothetical protein [Sporosarcina luteola]|uniref:hypothetical protein n=1 Tax=Sporosarcina luteola TaxID=582850 RepID=UPI0020411268|nr:hypothetical protein [Sporosarcina luteola]MCM3710720.1 hypothetical protein [Sporosarcina luteola]
MIIYDLGNITDWLTSIGTIGAVIVALYLARRDDKPRAKVKSTMSYGVSHNGGISRYPLFINLEIVNIGKIPIHLSECTIQMSKFNNKRMAFPDGSQNVKILLNPGEFYEHKLAYEPIYNYLKSEGIKKLKTYMFFKSSLGKVYKTKIILRS